MEKIDEYIIVRSLGRGASAQVFEAIGADEKHVALKVFHPGFWDQPSLRKRALAEYKTISELNHPNILKVLKLIWNHDPPAFVLELIEGGTLEELQGRLPYVFPEIAVLIVIEILRALEFAHSKGIIHRDLKPANIMIDSNGRVLVTDFGLAKLLDVSRITLTGTLIGSPDYMSPEQAKGEPVASQSDCFSVASILYYLVTGTRPFAKRTPLATLAAVIESNPEAPQNRNTKISPRLSNLILKGLSKNPEDRFESAAHFREQLEKYLLSLGMQAGSNEFQRWQEHPSQYVMSSMEFASECLEKDCQITLDKRDFHAFHESLAHLSLIAPESEAVEKFISTYDQLKRKKRLKRGLIWITPVFLIAGFFGFWMKQNFNQNKISPRAEILRPEFLKPIANPPIDKMKTSQSAAIPRTKVKKRKPQMPVPLVKEKTSNPKKFGKVEFVLPKGVRVKWGGRLLQAGTSRFRAEVGSHRVEFHMQGKQPIIETIQVSDQEPTIIRVK